MVTSTWISRYGHEILKPLPIRPPFFQTTAAADAVVDIIVGSVERMGVDGLDLVQRDGCGSNNLVRLKKLKYYNLSLAMTLQFQDCQDQVGIQLYLIERLREVLPTKLLRYTFPTGHHDINYPFLAIVKYALPHLDLVTMFGADFDKVSSHVQALALPKDKVNRSSV